MYSRPLARPALRSMRAWLVGLVVAGCRPATPRIPRLDDERQIATTDAEELLALARLYGHVRRFHPSDEAAAVDWDAFAVDADRRVLAAQRRGELQSVLTDLFTPLAPSVVSLRGYSPRQRSHPACTPLSGSTSDSPTAASPRRCTAAVGSGRARSTGPWRPRCSAPGTRSTTRRRPTSARGSGRRRRARLERPAAFLPALRGARRRLVSTLSAAHSESEIAVIREHAEAKIRALGLGMLSSSTDVVRGKTASTSPPRRPSSSPRSSRSSATCSSSPRGCDRCRDSIEATSRPNRQTMSRSHAPVRLDIDTTRTHRWISVSGKFRIRMHRRSWRRWRGRWSHYPLARSRTTR